MHPAIIGAAPIDDDICPKSFNSKMKAPKIAGIETINENLSENLRVIAVLTDAILNDATPKQSQVIYYKLLGYKESEIAEKMKIYQSGVNNHSSSAKWYCIEEALNYFEQIKFENYE